MNDSPHPDLSELIDTVRRINKKLEDFIVQTEPES